MASTKGKEKLFRLAGPLLAQILKIWLNTQSHKTLSEGEKRKKLFYCIPSRKHKETYDPNERVPGQMSP